MAEPDYFKMLGIRSPEEERTRTLLAPAADSGYGSYYQSFAARRPAQPVGGGMQRRYSARDWDKAQQKAAYEQDARRTLQSLSGLDPADPELTTKQESLLLQSRYGQDLVRDPRVTSVLKNRFTERAALEKQFQEDPDSQTDYLIARREGADHRTALSNAAQAAAQRKERLWFVEKGGNLEDFDSGQFMRNGRFDRAAAQSYINQLPPKKKAEDNKPWQERLSFKEGEAIRTAARGAKEGAFDDFEAEFTEQTTKKDEPFKGTRDEYVKQFKGDPDFNSYKQRRLMETGQTLMDEYGLNAEEAAQVLGIRQTPVDRTEVAPAATSLSAGNLDSSRPQRGPEAMFEGVKPTTLAQVEGDPAVAPTGTVSPADLKKIEPGAPQPVSFESLRASRNAEKDQAARAREEEFLARQKQTEATSGQWETAKNELLQAVTPEDLTITELDFTNETPTNPYAILARMGKKQDEVAFKDPKGKEVSWGAVLSALVSDPRWKGESAGEPSKKSFSKWWEGK